VRGFAILILPHTLLVVAHGLVAEDAGAAVLVRAGAGAIAAHALVFVLFLLLLEAVVALVVAAAIEAAEDAALEAGEGFALVEVVVAAATDGCLGGVVCLAALVRAEGVVLALGELELGAMRVVALVALMTTGLLDALVAAVVAHIKVILVVLFLDASHLGSYNLDRNDVLLARVGHPPFRRPPASIFFRV